MRRSVAKFTRRLVALSISSALLLTAVGAAPVAACDWGCTPGYWKNHTDMWPAAYAPSMTLKQAGFTFPATLQKFEGVTLNDALRGGGGPGLDGATTILMRAATASLLNSTFPEGHGMLTSTVLTNTNQHLATLDRESILAQATALDDINNLYCPY